MTITIQYTENELKELVYKDLQSKLGDIPLEKAAVHIETKSKQNYKSEWESGAGFRATYQKMI